MRLVRVKTCHDHDPLELLGLLPFLELHRPLPTSNPGIKVAKQVFELLNPKVAHPAAQVFVQLADNLVQNVWLLHNGQPYGLPHRPPTSLPTTGCLDFEQQDFYFLFPARICLDRGFQLSPCDSCFRRCHGLEQFPEGLASFYVHVVQCVAVSRQARRSSKRVLG